MFACHKCRYKNCVNPDHIVWGTAKDNAEDRKRDGTEILVPRHFRKLAVLSAEMAVAIFDEYHQGDWQQNELARKHKVSPRVIRNLVNRITYADATAGRQMKTFSHGNAILRGANHRTSKLDEGKVIAIKSMLLDGIHPLEIAKQYNITTCSIYAIRSGRLWKHLLPKDAEERKAHLLSFPRLYGHDDIIRKTNKMT